MKNRAWMLLLACTFNAAQAENFCELPPCDGIAAKTFSAKIIVVIDGDTVLIRRRGLVKIRLAEIDAPEVGHAGMGGQPPNSQPFGEESKQSLSGMVLGKQVDVTSQAIDKYGRIVAHLSLNGLDVNAEQIRRGMAWEYSNYHSNKALMALQIEAQNASLGLWAQSNPTPPWVWRKLHPNAGLVQSDAAASSVAVHATTIPSDSACGDKKRCSEMTSCDEAMHYFTVCGIRKLDENRNGIPCDKLCARQQR